MTNNRQTEADRLRTSKPVTILRSGIDARAIVIPGEDRAGLEALVADYHSQFPARNAVERYLVDTLVHCDWIRRRLLRVQADLYSVLTLGPDLIHPLGYAWQKDSAGSDALQKVFRQLNAIDRTYFRAFNEIRRLQRPPAVAEPEPEPAFIPPPTVPMPSYPQIGGFGFVPPQYEQPLRGLPFKNRTPPRRSDR
ncbi:MAG: hypothetical protein ABSC23_15480 [Bryobacteraceae bacterium]|jgi:hypothetical protein